MRTLTKLIAAMILCWSASPNQHVTVIVGQPRAAAAPPGGWTDSLDNWEYVTPASAVVDRTENFEYLGTL